MALRLLAGRRLVSKDQENSPTSTPPAAQQPCVSVTCTENPKANPHPSFPNGNIKNPLRARRVKFKSRRSRGPAPLALSTPASAQPPYSDASIATYSELVTSSNALLV